MSEAQLITFGGVIALLILRQPLIAIAWVLVVVLSVLPSENLVPGIALLIFVSIFLNFNREANK
jgi:hypothetical protein